MKDDNLGRTKEEIENDKSFNHICVVGLVIIVLVALAMIL